MALKQLRQAKSIVNIYNSAFWHLSQQDYTISEIRTKLARKTENQAWIETVVADLVEKRYLKPDIDFATQYAESSFRNELGKAAIKHKLCSRGISEKDTIEAIEHVINEYKIDLFKLAESRLRNSFPHFHSTSREKLYSQLTTKGFSKSEIDYALSCHPDKDSLKSNLQLKATKADLSDEVMKLYKKGKGKTLIRQELRSRLMNLDQFDTIIQNLEQAGKIDFFLSCQEALNKKRYDLTNKAEKSKAYVYLCRKGFVSDEIKETLSVL